MSQESLRFCVGCRHYKDEPFTDFGLCHHPKNTMPVGPDLIYGGHHITGKTLRYDPYDLRYGAGDGAKARCGQSGEWFEAKVPA